MNFISKDKIQSIKNLFTIYKNLSLKSRKKIILLLGIQAVSGVLEVSSLFFLSKLTSEIFTSNIQNQKDEIFLVLPALLVITGVSRIIANSMLKNVSGLAGYEVTMATYQHLLYQPLEYHLQVKRSLLITYVNTFCSAVLAFGLIPAVNILSSAIILLVLSSGLFLITGNIAIYSVLALAIIYKSVSHFLKPQVYNINKLLPMLNTSTLDLIKNSFDGIKEIKLENLEQTILERKKADFKNLRMLEAQKITLLIAPKIILETSILLLVSLCFVYSSYVSSTNLISDVIIILIMMQRIIPLAQNIFSSYQYINLHEDVIALISYQIQGNKDRISNENMVGITDNRSRLNSKFDANQKIIFKDLNFCYKTDNSHHHVFENLNLEIPLKGMIALVGKSGSGKSTLLSLLSGLLSPSQGSIELSDQTATHSIPSSVLKNNVACVFQRPYFSSDTIKKYLQTKHDKNSKDHLNLIKVVLEKMHVDFTGSESESINLDFYMGENACFLSGGQQQRLAIAKAILSDKQILLLDESLTGLNKELTDKILLYLEEISQNKLVLLVSHDHYIINSCSNKIFL